MIKLFTYFSILTCLCLPHSLSAQSSDTPPNHFLLELGGYGIKYSLNYNRILTQSSQKQLEARIGFSAQGIGIGIPAALTLVLSPRPHRLQASIGGNLFIDNRPISGTDTFVYLGAGLGYRFEPSQQRWFLFLTINPMLKTDPTAARLIDPNPVRIVTGALGIGWKLGA